MEGVTVTVTELVTDVVIDADRVGVTLTVRVGVVVTVAVTDGLGVRVGETLDPIHTAPTHVTGSMRPSPLQPTRVVTVPEADRSQSGSCTPQPQLQPSFAL